MIKKYYKNFGIIAGMITTANINKAADTTGAITISIDGVEYKDDGSCKIDLTSAEKTEEDIMNFLQTNESNFKNDGKNIDHKINNTLITKIEGESLTYDATNYKYTFTKDKPLTIHLKSKDYIKIEYTGEKQIKYDEKRKLIKSITNGITVQDLFETIKDNFTGNDLGKSKINNEGKDSTKKFSEIDSDNVIIKLDSDKIDENKISTFIVDADNVKFIKEKTLQILNGMVLNFKGRDKNIGDLKTTFESWRLKKQIITGPFKIKIDGTGNEIPSDQDATDLTGAKFIRFIADKNTFDPVFIQKEFKFEINGGNDQYVISDGDIKKIQESLDKLTNLEEVTEKEIFDELKKLEKDIFVENGITDSNVKCFKGDSATATKNDFGTDITVKIDPKAINPDKIKVKITLGDIKNKDNINLDSTVVNAINDKLKKVKFGITVNEILAILNDNTLKGYFTAALVDTDILSNDGTVLTTPITQNSVIKFKVDKLKSEYFKKTQNKSKGENQNGEGQKDEGPKAKKCCGSN